MKKILAALVVLASIALSGPAYADVETNTHCPSACIRFVFWRQSDDDLIVGRIERWNPIDNNVTYDIDSRIATTANRVQTSD